MTTIPIITDMFNRNRTVWWENFMQALPHGVITTEPLWYERRDDYLAEFGATLRYKGGEAWLEFETAEQCTAFLLRFS